VNKIKPRVTGHTKLRKSAFSSEASCFLMKDRTAWTASGSATSIMSIISPSPGRVIAFAINSWKIKGTYISPTYTSSKYLQCTNFLPPPCTPQKGGGGWGKYTGCTLSKLESQSMLLSPCTNFGFRTKGFPCWKSTTKLSISFLAKTCPASQLRKKKNERYTKTSPPVIWM